MIPFKDPTATVRFSTKVNTTKSIPAMKAATTMAARFAGQREEQRIQRELPRDRLRPGWHSPHISPERPLAHCASDPFGIFRFIATLALAGWQ